MLHNIYRLTAGRGRVFAVLAIACFLSACSEPDETVEVSQEQLAQLEQRVTARWQTLVNRDFGQTWEYSTPAFRETFPKRLYVLKFSYTVEWELTGVEVLNYDARAAVASVVVRVMSKPTKFTSAASRAVGATPKTIHEQWILIDGEWWFSANS